MGEWDDERPFNIYDEVERDARRDYDRDPPDDDRPTRAEAERDNRPDPPSTTRYLTDDDEEF